MGCSCHQVGSGWQLRWKCCSVSPVDAEVVVVGELHVAGGRFPGNNWQRTWSYCLVVGGFVGWLFFGPGITKSWPGKSDQRRGGVHPANSFEVGLEFSALCGGGGARPHLTGFIVAINKAFSVDLPADAHAGDFVPLGMIPHAFSCKIALPNLAFFNSLTAIGPYKAHRFSWASFKLNC
jgi:hypothetical protein